MRGQGSSPGSMLGSSTMDNSVCKCRQWLGYYIQYAGAPVQAGQYYYCFVPP